MKHSILLLLVIFATSCYCWDTEQLEVFDVVEEVKENFYEMLSLSQNATSKDIKSAFRRLSLVLHPDKNSHEDAALQFRNLVSVYEVLKDDKKRAYYDDVLVNGMPNWKSAMYYYRRVRKMGILEGSIIIFTIFTIGQYLVAWAAYAETIYTLQQQVRPTKKSKKGGQQTQGPVIIETVPKPSVFNTLPFQIPYWSFKLVISIPSFIMFTKGALEDAIEERREAQALKEEQEEEEAAIKRPPKPKKKKNAFAIPEGPTFEANYSNVTSNGDVGPPPPVSGGFWSDDDLDELVQLVKKYPGGTSKRWEVIAEFMGRSVAEVTFMANKLKTSVNRQQQEEEQIVEEKVKTKTKGGKLAAENIEESAWLQSQQRALEDALAKYPKGSTDRWDRIAELVPNKTKEECMLRYKHLVEVIKKQKEKQDKKDE